MPAVKLNWTFVFVTVLQGTAMPSRLPCMKLRRSFKCSRSDPWRRGTEAKASNCLTSVPCGPLVPKHPDDPPSPKGSTSRSSNASKTSGAWPSASLPCHGVFDHQAMRAFLHHLSIAKINGHVPNRHKLSGPALGVAIGSGSRRVPYNYSIN